MSDERKPYSLVLTGKYKSIDEAQEGVLQQLINFLAHYNIPLGELSISPKVESRVTEICGEYRVIVTVPYRHKKKLKWPL